jgi:hypothetical protein
VLSELTASTSRLAMVGLAKNTGKTEALGALLRELQAQGTRVGVTSVGRDGEEHDVIDARIDKPRVQLVAGSLVATTDSLLSASGIPHERLEQTDVRTPLGRVVVARLRGAGAIEVAGPSGSADVRMVSDAMLAHGAQRVLIDGAVDRRAASSPDVADGLVMSTGAVLGQDVEDVVAQTRDAVDLVRLATLGTGGEEAGVRAIAEAADATTLVGADGNTAVELAPRFALRAEAEQIAQALDDNADARWVVVAGALPDRFLDDLAQAAHRRRRELTVVAADSTRVFLNKRGPEWYRRQGIALQVLTPIDLRAITVNPLAPQSHRLDSHDLRAALSEAVEGVAVVDVLHADYPQIRPGRAA